MRISFIASVFCLSTSVSEALSSLIKKPAFVPAPPLKLKTIPPDVEIRSNTDLPTIPTNAILGVYYAEQIIKELGTVGELVEAYHSGLVFRFSKKEGPKATGIPSEFTIQWYAFDFPFGAFLPKDKRTLLWNNTACAHYTPAVDPHRWTKGEQLVGTITGEAFNAFANWTVEYCKERPGYQAFEVWDRPQLQPQKTKRWAESNTCSSFVEAALTKLYKLGGDFKGAKELLRRSYVPLISKTRPSIVNMKKRTEAEEVKEFYGRIESTVVGNDGMSTSEFIRFLADKLEVFFVYESHIDTYLRVTLDPPYLALTQLYQPMVLPWQQHDLGGYGAADFSDEAEARGDFLSELSSAAEASQEILRRRLPTVLKRRVEENLPILVSVSLIGLFAATKGGDLHVDESFTTGLLVGFTTGLLGPRLLSQNEEE